MARVTTRAPYTMLVLWKQLVSKVET